MRNGKFTHREDSIVHGDFRDCVMIRIADTGFLQEIR